MAQTTDNIRDKTQVLYSGTDNYMMLRIFLILFFSNISWAGPQAFNVQGRMFDINGDIVDSGTIPVILEVRDPSGDCLLYEEEHNIDMSESDGFFSISLGLGTQNTTTAPNFTLTETISNSAAFNHIELGCTGDSYTPNPVDHRRLRVTINGDTLSPDQSIRATPYAMNANNSNSLNGYDESDFIQSAENVTQSRLEDFFSTASTLTTGEGLRWDGAAWEVFTPGSASAVTGVSSMNAYLAVANGTTTPQLTLNVGAVANTVAAGDDTRFPNASCASGNFMRWDGSSWQCEADSNTDTTYSPAVSGVSDGLLTAADKQKLDGLDNHSLDASDGSPIDALFVDADGNVGIGTLSPGSELDIDGTVRTNILRRRGTVGGSYIDMSDTHLTIGAYTGGGSELRVRSSFPGAVMVNKIVVPNNSDTAASFSGNIGFGIANPNHNIQLHEPSALENKMRFTNTDTGTGVADGIVIGLDDGENFVIYNNESSGDLHFGSSSGWGLSVRHDGNVGIGGETDPSEKLQIRDGDILLDRGSILDTRTREITLQGARSGSTSGYAQINFMNYDTNGSETDYTGARIASHNFGGDNDGDIRFFTTSDGTLSSAPQMTITPAGRVGVATSHPDAPLEVVHNAGLPNATNSDPGNYVETAALKVGTDFDAGGNALYMGAHNAGNSKTTWIQSGHTNSDYASLATGSRLLLQPVGGRVGIGTNSPIYPLHVDGVIHSSTGGLRLPDNTVIASAGDLGEDNVNADWNASSGDAEILNKPTIPDGNSLNAADNTPVDALIVDNDGNVGIGTTSPVSGLNIDTGNALTPPTSGTNPTSALRINQSGSAITLDVGIISGAGAYMQSALESDLSNNNNLLLNPNGGNIGIGTSGPAAVAHIYRDSLLPTTLRVENSSSTNYAGALIELVSDSAIRANGVLSYNSADNTNWFSGVTYGTGNYTIGYYSAVGPHSSASQPENSKFTVKSNGHVGIGTNNPERRLHVDGASGSNILIDNAGAGTGDVYSLYRIQGAIAWSIGIDDSDDDKFKISRDGHAAPGTGDLVTIDSSGRVGIGVTDPEGALDVSSTTGAFIPPRMSTTERDNLTSAPGGSIIYNHITDKLNLKEDGVWVELHAGRERLVNEDRIYYVRPDGNDSNTGLINDAGGALLTIDAAVDKACGLDLNGEGVTIQLADGSYDGTYIECFPLGLNKTDVFFTIVGNAASPQNVILNSFGEEATVTAAGNGVAIKLESLEIRASGGETAGVAAHDGAKLVIGENIRFGSAPGPHMVAGAGGRVEVRGPYTIADDAPSHMAVWGPGIIIAEDVTTTLVGTPGFSSHFVEVAAGGKVFHSSGTFIGSATGGRYSGSLQGLIFVDGAGTNYFPGNSSGSVDSSSVYY